MEGPKRPLPADSASDGQVVLKKQKTGAELATTSQQPGVLPEFAPADVFCSLICALLAGQYACPLFFYRMFTRTH